MSFGWSVGDIIAAIRIIHTVAGALHESRGSGPKYRETDQTLTSLVTVLERLKDSKNATDAAPPQDVARLRDAILAFQNALSTKYGVAFDLSQATGVGGGGWKRQVASKLKMVEYRTFTEKKVDELVKRVDGPLRAISMHLQLRVKDVAEDTQELTRQIYDMHVRQEAQANAQAQAQAHAQANAPASKDSREKKRAKVLRWLKPVTATQNKFDARKEDNVGGSGQWLLQRHAYQRWLAATPPGDSSGDGDSHTAKTLLWISGIPGSGKTSLATSVVQALQSATGDHHHKVLVAFFYCDAQVYETTSLEAILRTWLAQLIKQTDCGLDDLVQAQLLEPEPSESTLRDALVSLLRDTARDATSTPTARKTVLVLDGLDECQPAGCRAFIKRVLPKVLPHARCAVFSRLTNNIVQLLGETFPGALGVPGVPEGVSGTEPSSGACLEHIHIGPDDTATDLANFSEREIGYLLGVSSDGTTATPTTKAMKDDLMQAFERRSNGMFQWVALIVGDLKNSYWEDYLEVVEEAPAELNDLYQSLLSEIWKRLRPRARARAKFILQWLACAMRPVRLQELDAALRVTMDEPMLHANNRRGGGHGGEGPALTVREVVTFCSTLVTVSRGGDDDGADTGAVVLSLAHTSVKEYLVDPENRRELFGDLIVDENEGHLLLGCVCMTYLCYDNVPMVPYQAEGSEEDKKKAQGQRQPLEAAVDAYLNRLPLQSYAAMYGISHFAAIGGSRGGDAGDDVLLPRTAVSSLMRLCRSEKNTIRWLQSALRVMGDRGVFLSSLFSRDDTSRLAPLARRLEGEARRDYLAWLAHLTGDRDANVFSRWRRFMEAGDANDFPSDAHVASMFEFVDYLRAYLENGNNNDPDVATFTGQTPLHFAARGESPACARLLLEHGAHVGAQGWGRHTPLTWAIDREGYEGYDNRNGGTFETASLLLDAGANPFVPEGGPPIYAAMKLAILDHYWKGGGGGVGPAKENPEEDPRHAALIRKMVTERDTQARRAKLRALDGGLYLVHYPAAKQAFDLMRLFLELGADVNCLDSANRTALDMAKQQGNTRAMDVLRSLGGKTSAELADEALESSRCGNDGGSQERVKDYWPKSAGDIFDAHLALSRMMGLSSLSRCSPGPPERPPTRAIIIRILDLAMYWLKTSAARRDSQVYDARRAKTDPVYLTTPPIPGRQLRPVCEIHFNIYSHDQGFSSYPANKGTFENSWTWVDCDFVSGGGGDGGGGSNGPSKRNSTGPVSVTRNLHAVKETTHHLITEWRDYELFPWLAHVQAGDHIVVYARAAFPGWMNYVEAMEVDIYSTCLVDM